MIREVEIQSTSLTKQHVSLSPIKHCTKFTGHARGGWVMVLTPIAD